MIYKTIHLGSLMKEGKMEETQCQAMNTNRMQCTNKAFVTVNDIAYCRLHFNWIVGQKELDLSPENLAKTVFPIYEQDQKEVDKIVESGRIEAKAEVSEASEQH